LMLVHPFEKTYPPPYLQEYSERRKAKPGKATNLITRLIF